MAHSGTYSRGFYSNLSLDLAALGLAALLMQFALSGRFKLLARGAGITTLMRFHQTAARLALVLLIAHPLLLVTAGFWRDPVLGFTVLSKLLTSAYLGSGTMGLLLLILLVPLAVLRDRLPIPYEVWRLSHGLGALAAAGFGVHHVLSVGMFQNDPLFVGSVFGLGALAAISVLFIYVLKPLALWRNPYRVVSNTQVADGMRQIILEPEKCGSLGFSAGQFAWVKFGRSPFQLVEHPFSMSTAPSSAPRIAFIIKEVGDFTRRVGDIAVGTHAFVDAPYGNLTLANRPSEGVVVIAGGVGFAPILAILRQLRAEHFNGSVCLIYGNRIQTQILFPNDLEEMKRELNLSVHLVLSEPPPDWIGIAGDLGAETLSRCLEFPDQSKRCYFIAGPPQMVASVERELRARGIPRRNIVAEHFKFA
jgi:predicted ferric reductase